MRHGALPGVARAWRAAALCGLSLAAAGCAASAGTGRAESAPERVLSFQVVDAGSRSGIDTPREAVIRSAEEWERLRQAHQAGSPGRRPAATVDFTTSLYVAIFAGQRPTGGFAVKVEQVVESADGLEVVYRVVGPEPGAIVSQALTSPYEIISVTSRKSPVRFRRLPEG